MISLRYLHLDVFANRMYEGNQLAVFLDGHGVSPDQMQRIAQEMAFSETTFILPAEREGDVRMRIFTPANELPMAGHPTIGSTFALAQEGIVAPGCALLTFELGVGPTPVRLEWNGDTLSFAWMTQRIPEFGRELQEVEAVAAALGLHVDDVVTAPLPQMVSCGVPFLFVPLASRNAVDAAEPDRRAIRACFDRHRLEEQPIFIFSTEAAGDDVTAYSRMFAPGLGVAEDPATGGASGPLGCYLVRHGIVPREQAGQIVSLQGVKMRRPSRIHVAIGLQNGGISSVEVGGQAVVAGEGTLRT